MRAATKCNRWVPEPTGYNALASQGPESPQWSWGHRPLGRALPVGACPCSESCHAGEGGWLATNLPQACGTSPMGECLLPHRPWIMLWQRGSSIKSFADDDDDDDDDDGDDDDDDNNDDDDDDED